MQNLHLQCVLLNPLCFLEVRQFAFRNIICTNIHVNDDLDIPSIWNVMKKECLYRLIKLIIASYCREGQVSSFVEYSRSYINASH